MRVQTKQFEENVRIYAKLKKDDVLLAKILGVDFIAKEIKYHQCCRTKYQTEAELLYKNKEKSKPQDMQAGSSYESNEPTYWHLEREVHKNYFEALTHLHTGQNNRQM